MQICTVFFMSSPNVRHPIKTIQNGDWMKDAALVSLGFD